MNKYENRWAKQHDWYIRSFIVTNESGYTIVVKDDMISGKELEFNNFEELKEWAGY